MILKYPHMNFIDTRGRQTKPLRRAVHPIVEVQCDKCGTIFTEKAQVMDRRIEMIGHEYCGKCARPLVSAVNGRKGQYDADGNLTPNAGRFTTERVRTMTDDQYTVYCNQRRAACLKHHATLNSDPEYKQAHYEKIYKKSKIGYISKGQREVHAVLKEHGFQLEHMIHGIRCDIAHQERKIVIEYYGDVWHANPRQYKPEDYLPLIKMTASDKWNKDRKRNFVLRNNGYDVIIIWESQWLNERSVVLDKLEKIISGGNHTAHRCGNHQIQMDTQHNDG